MSEVPTGGHFYPHETTRVAKHVPPVLTSTHNDGYEPVAYGEHTDEPVDLGGVFITRPPLSANAETHKRSEKVTTVTIEFERMPVEGFTQGRVKMVFTRLECVMLMTGKLRQLVRLDATIEHEYPGFGTAVLHPNDTFDWEIGMREAARDLVWCIRSGDAIFRAFRRWMWLAKIVHNERIVCGENGLGDKDPAGIIAREFGQVRVSIS
jgi:hypothetical protein